MSRPYKILCVVVYEYRYVTTSDLDITAGLITVGFVTTGSDVITAGYELENEKNDWGWAKTSSEAPHHCRFVA